MQKKNALLFVLLTSLLAAKQSNADYDFLKTFVLLGISIPSIIYMRTQNKEKKPLDDEIEIQDQQIKEKTTQLNRVAEINQALLGLRREQTTLLDKKSGATAHITATQNSISSIQRASKNRLYCALRAGSTLTGIGATALLCYLVYTYMSKKLSPEELSSQIKKLKREIENLTEALEKAKGTAKEKALQQKIQKKEKLHSELKEQYYYPKEENGPSFKAVIGNLAVLIGSGWATWKLAQKAFPYYTPTHNENKIIQEYKKAIEEKQTESENLVKKITSKNIEISSIEAILSRENIAQIKKSLLEAVQEKNSLQQQQQVIQGEDYSSGNPISGLLDLIKSISFYA